MFPIGDLIPIGDQNRQGAPFAYVTATLVALNILVFIYMLTLSPARLQSFIFSFGTIPAEIVQGQNLFTLVTSQFIHAGYLHIIANMFFLWVFGDNIEVALGRGLYILFYFGAGILAALAHVFFNPQSAIPSIGASGAIAAVLGAYIVLFPNRQVRVLVLILITRVTVVVFLGVWAVLQLLSGLASLGVPTAQTGGVAVWAHIGGFAAGLIVGLLARRAGRQNRA